MEVACNLAPFGAASNNNLNPIMEDTLELESSDDSHNGEEIPTVLQDQNGSSPVIPDNGNSNVKLVQHHTNNHDETNGNHVQQSTSTQHQNNG